MIFDLLGSHANIDLARYFDEIFNLSEKSKNTKLHYTINYSNIIRVAYSNNHRCVIKYLVENFPISSGEIRLINMAATEYNDKEILKYIIKRYYNLS